LGFDLVLIVKTNLCFRYEGEMREERNLVIFKGTSMNIYGEVSDLFIDVVYFHFKFELERVFEVQ